MAKKMIEMRKATQVQIARNLTKTLGMRSAAGYLRNRGWSIEASLYILLGK